MWYLEIGRFPVDQSLNIWTPGRGYFCTSLKRSLPFLRCSGEENVPVHWSFSVPHFHSSGRNHRILGAPEVKHVVWTLPTHMNLLHRVNPLNYHRSRCAPSVADCCHSVLSGLQLMEQCRQDPRPRIAECMTEGDGTTEEVDIGVFEAKDLDLSVFVTSRGHSIYLFIRFNHGSKCLIELPDRDILLLDTCSL
jgi:hypothetical protein